MSRLILRPIAITILVLVALYAADAIVWHIRNARGSGMDEVTVTQVSAASLKGKKEEYYVDGSTAVSCARSLAHQFTAGGWLPPCWYLRRTAIQVTHL